jgi:hypothetical protein
MRPVLIYQLFDQKNVILLPGLGKYLRLGQRMQVEILFGSSPAAPHLFMAAKNNGVHPSPALLWLRSDLHFMSSWTASEWPFEAASDRGDSPLVFKRSVLSCKWKRLREFEKKCSDRD